MVPLSVTHVQFFTASASGARETRDLGETTRDQRRQRVVPEPESFDDAGGYRDDVLHRGANLDAGHIVVAVLSSLMAQGSATAEQVKDAIARYGIDPDTTDPMWA